MSGFEGEDIRTMVVFGQGEDAKWWVDENTDKPDDITKFVLFPAARYGQVNVLRLFMKYGNVNKLETDDKNHLGWNLYHYAIYGYHMNCAYLLNDVGPAQAVSNSSGPKTPDEARQIQLDVIYALHEGGALPGCALDLGMSLEPDLLHPSPLHPSLMSLERESNFSEAAFLIDILSMRGLDQPVPTPGLDNVNVTSDNDHRRALYHLIEWSYTRGYLDILTFCHDRYLSLCSDSLRFRKTNFPIFLAAVRDKRLEVLEMVFTHQSKRPLPDRILSRPYSLCKDKEFPKLSAVGIAAEMCLDGYPDVMNEMLTHQIIGTHLVNVSLSELELSKVPVELFHVNLWSLSLSQNNLTELPPVDNWKSTKLAYLNLSGNKFKEVPPGMFSLPKLLSLDLRNNEVSQIDGSLWTAPSLKSLYMSNNLIESLPCPEIDEVALSIQSSGLASPGSPDKEHCYSIKHGFVDITAERDEDYYRSHSGYSLEFIDLSENRLTSLPIGLPCLAPMLQTLKLNKNRISKFGNFSKYPTLLKSLDLSYNNGRITILPNEIPTPYRRLCYQSKPDQIQKCSHSEHWRLVNLQHLNLSHNSLEEITIELPRPLGSPLPHLNTPGEDDTLFFPKLHSLYLNSNNLGLLPPGIHKQEQLGTLDIRDNPGITELPLKLHLLKNLISFQYKGISDPIIGSLDTLKDTRQMLYYLRARETDAVSNRSMRLFVIGHSQKGKSTILRTLKGDKLTKDMLTKVVTLERRQPDRERENDAVGIQCDTWECIKRKGSSSEPITFYTWDFAGQDEYYVTHQCFLTNRALYLLVWKITDKEQGIEGLSVWLRNLQAGAPYAQVIVIGTHLDIFRKTEKHCDALLDNYRKKILQECTFNDRTAPKIKGIVFVGLGEPSFFSPSNVVTPLKYDELHDKIYDVAYKMEVPRSFEMPNFSMRVMDEKIPKCYSELEKIIFKLLSKNPDNVIYKRSEFCSLKPVKAIINDEQEVDAAISFLHNMGRVFHFPKPLLEDYYILSPQWWFNACALVISPNIVSNLVTAGSEPGSGLLNFSTMRAMFDDKGYNPESAGLIFSFLHQYGVLLPVDKETALVPSMISPIPCVKLFTKQGAFPRDTKKSFMDCQQSIPGFFDFLPAALKSLESDMKINSTGLVYRRQFLLPPLPAGFWSKLIALCLQKDDFIKIISNITENRLHLVAGGHGLYYDLGNSHIYWRYWKTGIVLYLNSVMLMSINSLKMDEFMDPMERSVISATFDKVRDFHFYNGNNEVYQVPRFSEIIEVVIPEVELLMTNKYDTTISAKLLAKGLEMIDEVLKGHCENLAENGIYTVGDMLHVVPCPICFGEKDHRMLTKDGLRGVPHPQLAMRIRAMSSARQLSTDIEGPVKKEKKLKKKSSSSNSLIVFSIDQCIRASMTGPYIECPFCKEIELEHLVPDIVYKDLSEMKLDRNVLSDIPGSDGSPIGCGCFGVVYHKRMEPPSDYEDYIEVAVKEFRSTDMDYDAELEVVKSYADMRYELNKLCMMEHKYIVKFVGLLTNPRSFILEWAPLMSLEKIRDKHESSLQNSKSDFHHFCPVSLYLIMLQVSDGLHYLHTPPIGIIHSDLKLSNILAYRIPLIDHECCYDSQDHGRCSACLPENGSCNVLVKLGDMGVCVNPAAHTADSLGVQRFAPENLRFVSKRTEKVDIFCLALCLFELMSLRGLPPRGMSEIEYKNQLKKSWRPHFHSKDPMYPLPLYLCLEQCWQQDYNMRPSALVIRNFLENMTGLYVNKSFQLPQESMYQLLDVYQLSTEDIVTHVCLLEEGPKINVCLSIKQDKMYLLMLAESCQDDSNRIIFRTSVLHKFMYEITSLHIVTTKHIYVGLIDGSLHVFSGNEPPYSILKPNEHSSGEINHIQYIKEENLLVVCSTNGRIFITNPPASFYSQMTHVHVFAHKVMRFGDYLEIWRGMTEAKLEVWSYSMDHNNKWLSGGPIEHSVSCIDLQHMTYTGPSSCVSRISDPCSELSSVFVVIYGAGRSCICQIDINEKTRLKYWQCIVNDISCFSIGKNEFVLGTLSGDIYFTTLDSLKETNTIPSDVHTKLKSHNGQIFHLFILKGQVHKNGYTSLFQTYLGKQRHDMPCSFLLSIGQGCVNFRCFDKKSLKSGNPQRNGICASSWIV